MKITEIEFEQMVTATETKMLKGNFSAYDPSAKIGFHCALTEEECIELEQLMLKFLMDRARAISTLPEKKND